MQVICTYLLKIERKSTYNCILHIYIVVIEDIQYLSSDIEFY